MSYHLHQKVDPAAKQQQQQQQQDVFIDNRRLAHSQSEQRRRNSIKVAYAELAELACGADETVGVVGDAPSSAQRSSRAAVLQAAIARIESLTRQRIQRERQLAALRKQVEAACLINSTYQRRRSQAGVSDGGCDGAATAAKLAVFQHVADSLASSFAKRVDASAGCDHLLDGLLDWLEASCSPAQLTALGQEALAKHLPSITRVQLNAAKGPRQ